MKKLNRKGFTLVELLAVIVILAIVVGITLVTVLPTLKDSRRDAFELTPQTAADYLEKQYQLYIIGEDTTVPFDTGSDFADLLESSPTASTTGTAITSAQFEAAGLKYSNYSAGSWYIDSSTGRACVELTAATRKGAKNASNEAGEYYDVYALDTNGYETTNSATAKSTGCK